MKAIVAVDLNWGIGYKGSLLQRIPEDMKNFRRITSGKVVIMGRETYVSLPGKEPLKDRVNIVLTRNLEFNATGVVVCHSMEELLLEIGRYDKDDVFVIGGESVYAQLLPICDEVLVTRINRTYTADKHFVRLDQDSSWYLEYEGEWKSYNNIEFRFTRYLREKV